MVDAVERIVVAHPGQRVAVVCHGGVINAYAGYVLGIDDPLFFLPDLHLASAGSSRRAAAIRSIGSLNEAAHLRDL